MMILTSPSRRNSAQAGPTAILSDPAPWCCSRPRSMRSQGERWGRCRSWICTRTVLSKTLLSALLRISLRVEGLTPTNSLRFVRLILRGNSKYPFTSAFPSTSSCLAVSAIWWSREPLSLFEVFLLGILPFIPASAPDGFWRTATAYTRCREHRRWGCSPQ